MDAIDHYSSDDSRIRSNTTIIVFVLLFALAEAFVMWSAASNPDGMIGGIFILRPDRSILIRLAPVLAGLCFSLLLATTFAWKLPALKPPSHSFDKKLSQSSLIAFLLAGTALGLAAVWVLRAFPISTDEYDYLFQAKTLLAGRFWNPVPPIPEAFTAAHIIAKEGKWVSQYQPGWPLLLAAVSNVGLPFWLAAPLCGGGALMMLAAIGARENGRAGAFIAVGLMALSPFFVLNAGSYYAHIPTALFALLFGYFGLKYIDEPDVKSALLAGAALGALGLIRTFDVFVFAAPFAIEFLGKAKKAHYVRLPWFVLGGAPFLLALMYYNASVTGDPFTQVIQWGTSMKIGLHPEDENGHIFGLKDAIRITFLRFGEFFEWTSPAFMLMYGIAFVLKAIKSRLRFYDFMLPAIAILYMAFPSSAGPRFGPRYYFEAYPFMVLTLTWLCVQLLEGKETFANARFRKFAAGLGAAHLATCVVSLVILSFFVRIVVDERSDLFDKVERMGLHHAVVIARTGTAGVYSTSLPGEQLRSGIDLSGDIVYADGEKARADDLKSLFPDRKFYIYQWPPGAKEGALRPLS